MSGLPVTLTTNSQSKTNGGSRGSGEGCWYHDVNSNIAVWKPYKYRSDEISLGKTNDSLTSDGFRVRSKVSHAFSAELQRMTVIASVSATPSHPLNAFHISERMRRNQGVSDNDTATLPTQPLGRIHSTEESVEYDIITDNNTMTSFDSENMYIIATKGSPESVFCCLHDGQRLSPHFSAWYHREFEMMASQGKRVLAFASREVCCGRSISGVGEDSVGSIDSTALLSSSREEVERDLVFQGFVSFSCPLR